MISRVGEGRVVSVERTRRGGRHSFYVVWGCEWGLKVNGFGKGVPTLRVVGCRKMD